MDARTIPCSSPGNTPSNSDHGNRLADSYGRLVDRLRRLAGSALNRVAVGQREGASSRTSTETIGATGPPSGKGYQTLVAIDICGFGRRDAKTQEYLRDSMYGVLRRACEDVRIGWPPPVLRDGGDGALMVLPEDDVERVVGSFVHHLQGRVRHHNENSSEKARMALRMAVHIGRVSHDERGPVGEPMVKLSRLLDATAFKSIVSCRGAILGMIVSPEIYFDVVRSGPGPIDPDSFEALVVENKETRAQAWIYVPARADPAGRSGLVSPPPGAGTPAAVNHANPVQAHQSPTGRRAPEPPLNHRYGSTLWYYPLACR